MQGRADGQEWVTSFLVSYSLDSINWYYIVDQYDNKMVRTTRQLYVASSSQIYYREARNELRASR